MSGVHGCTFTANGVPWHGNGEVISLSILRRAGGGGGAEQGKGSRGGSALPTPTHPQPHTPTHNTHHSREDLPQCISCSVTLPPASFVAVLKDKQALSHWVGVGHMAVVHKRDVANPPTLGRRERREHLIPQHTHQG